MLKSLVRVSLKARDPKTKEYQAALKEFIQKMGGPQQILAALHTLPKPNPTLFDNIYPGGAIIKQRVNDENFGRCM